MKLLSIVLISTAVSRSVPIGNALNKRDSHKGKEKGKEDKLLESVGAYGAPKAEEHGKNKEGKKPEGEGKGYDAGPESNAYHVDKPVNVGYPTDEKEPQPAPAPVTYDEKPAPTPVTYDEKPEPAPVTYEKPAYPEVTADVLASSATSTIASMAVFAIALFL